MDSRLARRRSFMMRGRPQRSGQARNHVRAMIQCRVRTNLWECRECQRFKSAHSHYPGILGRARGLPGRMFGGQWSPDRIRAVHPTNSVKHFLDEILLWRVVWWHFGWLQLSSNAQSLWNIPARCLTLTTPKIGS
jgi:hypothetical protein